MLFRIPRTALISEPILRYMDYNRPVLLYTDASDCAIGAILSQQDDENREYVVGYGGRSLSRAERNYGVSEKELLAICYGLGHFKHLIYGTDLTVVTGHKALQWLKSIPAPKNRLGRWSMILSNWNFQVQYRPGSDIPHADCVSRIRYEDIQPDDTYLPTVNAVVEGATDAPMGEDYVRCFREAQRRDPNLRDIIKYVEQGALPAGDENARKVLIESEFYTLNDNRLLCKVSRTARGPGKPSLILMVPDEMIHAIIEENHDPPSVGHPGIARTLERIRGKYAWKNMYQDVRHYVSSCLSCGGRKRPRYPNYKTRITADCMQWSLGESSLGHYWTLDKNNSRTSLYYSNNRCSH